MSETVPAAPPKPRFALVALHASQLMLAISVLSLALFGVQYFAYNILVYTIVVALCTILVCAYLMISHTYVKKVYSPYVAAAYHAWMLIFWVVDLGLLAHLAVVWQSSECINKYRNGFTCAPYSKRDGTMPYDTFYSLLVAGAVLAACELALWMLTTTMIYIHARMAKSIKATRRRSSSHVINRSNIGVVSSTPMEEIQLTPILHNEIMGTITITPVPAATPEWETSSAQEVRPGPQPLIGDDEHGFSRDGAGAVGFSFVESHTRSTPAAIIVEEDQDQLGTPRPRPTASTHQVRSNRLRIPNATEYDPVFTIGE